jgi:hypothetical protein
MRDTMEMAREAGWTGYDSLDERFKAFEALVRADAIADEREACAKVCDDAFSSSHAGRVVCDNLAYAIRARGST